MVTLALAPKPLANPAGSRDRGPIAYPLAQGSPGVAAVAC